MVNVEDAVLDPGENSRRIESAGYTGHWRAGQVNLAVEASHCTRSNHEVC